jgi:cellulose synthase/poly-beta-1,6-N-acetylglucosamine synthase-like glycosyltransferase
MTINQSITVGICAYNEESNIEQSVRSVYSQILQGFSVNEVIVISSGSTDRTDEIIKNLMLEYNNLRLIRQEKREGKNSAINCLLNNKCTEIIILLNADNVLAQNDSLSNLIRPLIDSKDVGIVGGHPVPTNPKKSIAGFASNFLWVLHHHISMIHPKIGELLAFRDIGTRLPLNSQSDEDILRMKLEEAGYTSVYAPNALVLNRGPETVADFLKQRVRVNIGERYIKKRFDYNIPTWNKSLIFSAFPGALNDIGFHPVKIFITISMEIYSRLKATVYVMQNKEDINAWSPVKTTKKL